MSDFNQTQFTREEEGAAPVPAADSEAPKRPKKKKRSKWLAFFVTIGILVACVAIAGGQLFLEEDHSVPFASGEKNVMMIDIKGQITAEGDTYNQKFILGKINEAKNDSDNKAILLMLDTPGGSVYECDEVYRQLNLYKEKTKRPVYAYCEGMCASAGYYIASTADAIYANRNSLVGSIGVICGQFVDATGLFDKLGVQVTTVHSGANKVMGSPYEKPTAEQIAIMQQLSDEAYEQFVGVVSKGRDMTETEVKALADGRIYSAKQCKANGLIDEIGTIDDIDKRIKKDIGGHLTFYHETYEQNPYEHFLSNLSSFLDNRTASSEFASTVKAVEDMSITEPMYLYQP